jgi:hypothetical protein
VELLEIAAAFHNPEVLEWLLRDAMPFDVGRMQDHVRYAVA